MSNTIWTKEQCIEQMILLLKSQPGSEEMDAEEVQDYLSISVPFRKQLIRDALSQFKTFKLSPNAVQKTYEDCIKQAQLILRLNADRVGPYVQDTIDIPYRKIVIRTAYYRNSTEDMLQRQKIAPVQVRVPAYPKVQSAIKQPSNVVPKSSFTSTNPFAVLDSPDDE